MLIHDSDTITPLYPAKYDDSPSTKFVFALFLNAKTPVLWIADKDPGPPIHYLFMDGGPVRSRVTGYSSSLAYQVPRPTKLPEDEQTLRG
ncbi:unnamed protein product [marine sediment metagenome]|uniref:Uncharacterized protein n=1 Tax=marine sediment metagenome TaxID=412755 RepID=X1TI93_9ZZZZ